MLNDPVNWIDPEGLKSLCATYPSGQGACISFDFVDQIRNLYDENVKVSPRVPNYPVQIHWGPLPMQDTNCILSGALCYYPRNEHTDPKHGFPLTKKRRLLRKQGRSVMKGYPSHKWMAFPLVLIDILSSFSQRKEPRDREL